MSTTTKPATKYRVAIRDIAIQHGWSFAQLDERTDKFTKDGDVVVVTHGPSNLITTAEIVRGNNEHDVVSPAGKMFQVQAWLTGQPDPDHQRYIRLTPEQVKRYESGQGIAKIAAGQAATPSAEKPVLAPKPAEPAKKAAPKRPAAKRGGKKLTEAELAAARKAAAGPAPKPGPRTATKA